MSVRQLLFAVFVLCCASPRAVAQHACQFYAQNPSSVAVTDAQSVELEVEIVYTNVGTSTWENTGGVSNLRYIELRPVGGSGTVIDGPLYHPTWINRQRVGSFLAIQQGVAPSQRARFVFKINVDGRALGVGHHRFYFRPYHAQGGYITDWGNCSIAVDVTSASAPAPGQVPQVSITGVSPSSPLDGATVTLSGSASNNPQEYRWEANGQIVGASASIQRSFSAGSYALRFLARNSYGWSQAATTQLVVSSSPAPPPSPPAPPTPSPVYVQALISSVSVERSVPLATSGTGSRIENVDLFRASAPAIRRYERIRLSATPVAGTVVEYEWSVAFNGLSAVLGRTPATDFITKPEDFVPGRPVVRLRAHDGQGNWSNYESFPIEVLPWPRIYLPIHGAWRRSGNDYNEGDHLGERAVGGQDWNHPSGGDNDFGLEVLASLPGNITDVGDYSDGGRYVNLEYEETQWGQRFRIEYMHLSTVLVQKGDGVSRGQPIALCGNTGTSSSASHLHYVVSVWENNRWVSVIPEPCFSDDQTVLQTIPYNSVVTSSSRMLPLSMMILPEQAVSARQSDIEGFGHQKYWDQTTAGLQPTSSCTWDFTLPLDGRWKLLMHNPSGITGSNSGKASHNTTQRAVFELSLPRTLGLLTFTVDQDQTRKGSLVPVAEFNGLAGDRITVMQHNATGETGREMSYDELVVTLVSASGSGGSSTGTSGPAPVSAPGPSVPVSSPQPSASPSPVPPATQPLVSGSGGGSGCSMSPSASGAGGASCCLLVLLLVVVLRRIPC